MSKEPRMAVQAGSTTTDHKQTDHEPKDADWLRRANIKIFYYP